MCGLAGFVQPKGLSYERANQIGMKMADTLAHRGRMGSAWSDFQSGTVLVHRRLAIVDLSDAGQQPMESASGRYVLTYNGEVYNHKDLRIALDTKNYKQQWRGYSDTETLLACIDEYGLEDALKKLNGMYSIAIYDRKERCVFLARDHAGEKPLYYGQQGENLFFASELKALRAHPEFRPEVDRNALSSYLPTQLCPMPAIDI